MGDKFFGPYLAERQWGTVREDYSFNGDCWKYCSHHDALNRVYLHGEDGLFGWSDYKAKLCSSLALWNGKDTILKERLFGLTGPQGNHGEDVKELYYYLLNVPNHNYMKALYQYPQQTFPYKKLIKENKRRCYDEPEFELIHTGTFDNGYWDIYMEFAKEEEKTCLCRYTVHNRGSEPAELYIMPQIWLRDTWSHYSCDRCRTFSKPVMKRREEENDVFISYSEGSFIAKFDHDPKGKPPTYLFTENDTQISDYTKNAFHRYIISEELNSVNPDMEGTKCGALYHVIVYPGKSECIQWCLYSKGAVGECSNFSWAFEEILNARKKSAKNFYTMALRPWNKEERNIACQAYAGLLWSKQFYCYDVRKWMESTIIRSDRTVSENALCRNSIDDWTVAMRNRDWIFHFQNCDIISMPDKWEFPWYAAWDLAFHMIPFSFLDPDFSKKQLLLLLSDNYIHPNGQIPAYEFNFSDNSPPVHCWACLSVYYNSGSDDVKFLKKCFHRLLLNYNWWINTNKIPGSTHLYSGGFLGMDNISIYNRSYGVPPGYILAQADATGWMAFFCVKMFEMAIVLCKTDPDYADVATQFLKYFIHIAENGSLPTNKAGFWHEEDKFFYDMLISQESDTIIPLCIRSLVGLIPLFATTVIDISSIEKAIPELYSVLKENASTSSKVEIKENRLFVSFVSSEQFDHILAPLFNEAEFLSPFGIRSLSKYHEENPYSSPIDSDNYQHHDDESKCKGEIQHENANSELEEMSQNGSAQNTESSLQFDETDGESNEEVCQRKPTNKLLKYSPGVSPTNMFGGNSNWRGPIWLCMNFLLSESLDVYYKAYGAECTVEFPTGSNKRKNFRDIRKEISKRIVSIFLPNTEGIRPLHGNEQLYQKANLRHLVLFYEYFNAENGQGCGASHQTGWTALVVEFIRNLHS